LEDSPNRDRKGAEQNNPNHDRKGAEQNNPNRDRKGAEQNNPNRDRKGAESAGSRQPLPDGRGSEKADGIIKANDDYEI